MIIRKLERYFIITFTMMFFLVIFGSCKSKQELSPIQVGGVYSLTGKAAAFGEWAKNGVDLAIEEINNKGGINGKKVEVLVEDTQSDPKYAVSAFQKLISVNKIVSAIGFISSSEALACAPIAERSKIVMITPVAGTPKLKEAGDYVFRTRESGLSQSHRIAEHILSDLGIKETTVLCENAANSIGYRDAFGSRYKALGGNISEIHMYDEGQNDFRDIITKVKQSKVKAVYAPGVGKIVGRILKQAREMGLEARFFSSAGLEDPELFRIAGEAADGVVFGAPAFALDSKNKVTQSFVKRYRDRFGSDPAVYAANAYDAALLLCEAIKRAKATESEIIKTKLYEISGFQGASGVIMFDSYGEVDKEIVLKETKDGRFDALVTTY